ncbi:RidA family protein [Komagataeibacter xylinus]|uniref:RidA family protein n=1 Tax=Komagataeibacter xylinus TaxID=28448 RepID=UPI0010327B2D|nr:RidA family protein [Komagataeibacter xylinus]
MFDLRKTVAAVAVLGGMAAAMPAHADDGIVRHVEGTFPISTAIEVPAGASTVYLSGLGPTVQDKKADPKSIAAYGDTQAQTYAALRRTQDALKKMGLDMADVVQMHIYMAEDPKLGKLDFDGMMKAYTQFYGPTAKQPNLPVRSAIGVAHLANPGWLVEVETTAVRAPGK